MATTLGRVHGLHWQLLALVMNDMLTYTINTAIKSLLIIVRASGVLQDDQPDVSLN